MAGLVFGIIVVANSDWIPGAITVAATVVGLASEIPQIRKLCTTESVTQPKSRPVT